MDYLHLDLAYIAVDSSRDEFYDLRDHNPSLVTKILIIRSYFIFLISFPSDNSGDGKSLVFHADLCKFVHSP